MSYFSEYLRDVNKLATIKNTLFSLSMAFALFWLFTAIVEQIVPLEISKPVVVHGPYSTIVRRSVSTAICFYHAVTIAFQISSFARLLVSMFFILLGFPYFNGIFSLNEPTMNMLKLSL